MQSENDNRVKLVGLIQTLETNVITQIACTRSRANLLKIKKLADSLRKDYLAVSKDLKEKRKLIPKKEKVVKDPNVIKKRAGRKKKMLEQAVQTTEPVELVKLETVPESTPLI